MMQIPDPVHGYIELDGMFADIVNTPEFQRLRSVEQGSFRPVYPGARHDRFAHSLGTYHLATQFVEHFFENLKKDTGVVLSAGERQALSLTFRYAALLHDIGHAPFSHTTEGFFAEKGDEKLPDIWKALCAAAGKENPEEGSLFSARVEKCGAPHEIVSALLLIRNKDTFLDHVDGAMVDPVLAARMVIGLTYQSGDLSGVSDELLGVRNCLIQLLNCSVLDVDRLDYMGRDTQMSGYVNAPLDLRCLAQSVTAVREGGMLVNAYREDALRVFDLMFQAKLSHDAWVLAAPAGAYDAALLEHCIRQLGKAYMDTVFTPEALSSEGVQFEGKHYRLLSDVDVAADLKARSEEAPFHELYSRELNVRRIAAWRSYYEYHHIFNWPEKGLTPEKVYEFFKPLIKYLNAQKLFVFDEAAYNKVAASGDAHAIRAAVLLRKFLLHPTGKREDPDYNVVLLDRTSNFTMKLNPEEIRIVFADYTRKKKQLPLREGKYTYSTYGEMTDVISTYKKDKNEPIKKGEKPYFRTKPYFYIMRHNGLGRVQLERLRNMLVEELNK